MTLTKRVTTKIAQKITRVSMHVLPTYRKRVKRSGSTLLYHVMSHRLDKMLFGPRSDHCMQRRREIFFVWRRDQIMLTLETGEGQTV